MALKWTPPKTVSVLLSPLGNESSSRASKLLPDHVDGGWLSSWCVIGEEEEEGWIKDTGADDVEAVDLRGDARVDLPPAAAGAVARQLGDVLGRLVVLEGVLGAGPGGRALSTNVVNRCASPRLHG